MAKITLILCDVKPCTLRADRDFQINGKTINVCGEGCYARYWSREYQEWKQNGYDLHANHTATRIDPSLARGLRLVSNNP